MLHFDAPTGTHGFYISFLFQTLFVFCYCSPLFLVIDTYSICLYIFVTKHTKNLSNYAFYKKFFYNQDFSLLYFWSFNIFAVVQSLNVMWKKIYAWVFSMIFFIGLKKHLEDVGVLTTYLYWWICEWMRGRHFRLIAVHLCQLRVYVVFQAQRGARPATWPPHCTPGLPLNNNFVRHNKITLVRRNQVKDYELANRFTGYLCQNYCFIIRCYKNVINCT